MSYSSTNTLGVQASIRDVIDFVKLLGFKANGFLTSDEVGRITEFFWFDDADYRSWSGVELSIYEKDSSIIVGTRTPISRSYYDLKHQNETIRLLRRYFGGTFATDEGRNRYQRLFGDPPHPAASGCHLAFQRFGSNLITGRIYLMRREFSGPAPRAPSGVYWIDPYNPKLISNNLLLPFLTSLLEDYWKSTFMALLKYSPKKEAALKSGRLLTDHLVAIANGESSVEQAIAESLSFLRVSAACRHFHLLDPKLDFGGVLRKPYRRRKVSLFESLEEMTDWRNEIIHRAKLNFSVTDEYIEAQFHNLEVAVVRCYKQLTNTYGWPYEKCWGGTAR